MNSRISKLALISSFLIIAWGCQHDNPLPDWNTDPGVTTTTTQDTSTTTQDTTVLGKVCDPDTVYFARDVLPLLISNCAMSGCHDVASHEEGVILTDYGQTMSTGGINPGNPNDGDFMEVLYETDPDDIMPPPPAAPLTPEEKAMLTTWIAQGAQDLSCDEGCDLTAVTFSASIWPIIKKNCEGCHNAAAPLGGVLLTNYDQTNDLAASGQLLGTITGQAGYVAMPTGGIKLADCDIQKIEAWIQAGSPNN